MRISSVSSPCTVTPGARSVCTVISCAAACSASVSATRAVISLRSTGCQCSGWRPLSARASHSSCESIAAMRPAWVWMTCNAARVSPVVSGRASAYSLCERITAVGVRSSCEASSVNCCSWSKASCRRANIASNSPASVRISSRPGGRPMRRERSPPARISRAVAVMCRTGANARRVTRYPHTAASTMYAGSTSSAQRHNAPSVLSTAPASVTVRTHSAP